jgi:hypothetical protein
MLKQNFICGEVMKRSLFKFVIFSLIFMAPIASANNIFVQAFLENAPLRQIKVELDGVIIGETNGNGVVEADIGSGEHTLFLINNETKSPVKFSLTTDNEIEISIIYSRDPKKSPVINSQIFEVGSSANGFLAGIVSSPTGIPIPNAEIYINDVLMATSSEEGTYSLELSRGIHSVAVYLDGYSSSEINDVRVMSGLGSYAGFKLFKESDESNEDIEAASFEEVVTLGIFNPVDGSENIERYATTVVSAIDSDQLSRFGDSDVADAITRMVGISVNDGKYANVRGLDGRYISTKFNGILMPSTDPMRRDIQLDLFPSNIVDTIEVQKSFSADQPATSTGGSLNVKTKGMPEDKIRSFSISYGENISQPDLIVTNKGSSHDWKGYDDGKRDLPDGALEFISITDISDPGNKTELYFYDEIFPGFFSGSCDLDNEGCATEQEFIKFTSSFDHDFSMQKEAPSPNESLSGSFGDRIGLKNYGDLGYFIAGSYSKNQDSRINAMHTNTLDKIGADERTKENIFSSLYGLVGYENDYGELLYKSTLLRSTDNLTKRSIYVEPKGPQFYDFNRTEYVERQLHSESLTGSFEFDSIEGVTTRFDFRHAKSETLRDEPGRKSYRAESTANGKEMEAKITGIRQRWSYLDETSTDTGFDFSISKEFGDNYFTIKLGKLDSNKIRSLFLYRFVYELNNDDIPLDSVDDGDEIGFNYNDYLSDGADTPQGDYLEALLNDIRAELEKASSINHIISHDNIISFNISMNADTDESDSYLSNENLSSQYISFTNEFSDIATVELGWRQEKFNQVLNYIKTDKIPDPLFFEGLYPSLNVTIFHDEDAQFRIGYSETVSYPGLIERSESASFDPDNDKKIVGVPGLIPSMIENFDIRYEKYLDGGNNYSIGLFHKKIQDPIERTVAAAGGDSGKGAYTFTNSIYASVDGVELDFNSFLIDNDKHSLFLNGNFSQIISKVKLNEQGSRLEGSSFRSLQGQSEFLANIQVGYDHFSSGQKLTLLFNYFSDRIYNTTNGGNTGHIIENGRTTVNMNYEKILSESWLFNIKLKNLTNEPITFSQDHRVIEIYEIGASANASFSYSF